MSTQETYELDGSTRFDFPHPVRDPQQLTVEVRPGNVVPPSDYEVVGYGPNATGVTIYYPDAPSDPDLELRITRFTEPDRVTRFSDGTPVQPKALDAEFDNLFQLYVDMPNYVDLAEDWASKDEDEEVEDGKYSAFHWAQKAQEWAEKPEDEETYDDGYSALHYSAKAEKSADDASSSASNAADSADAASDSREDAHRSADVAADRRDKAEEWAENPEDEEVEDGKYSARHWSAKAEGHSSDAADSADAASDSREDAHRSADVAAGRRDKAEEWAENPEDEEVEDGKYSAFHWAQKAEASAEDAVDSASSVSPDSDTIVKRDGDGRVYTEPGGDDDNHAVAQGDLGGAAKLNTSIGANSRTAGTVPQRDSEGRIKSLSGGSNQDCIVWGDTGKGKDEVPTNGNLGDSYTAMPIGVPFPVWDHLSGVSSPDNSGSIKFIRLTAGEDGDGEYNSGLLANETVSGQSPEVEATAEIDYSDSPLDGEEVHLINTEESFLRARESSGDFQLDQMQKIEGEIDVTGLTVNEGSSSYSESYQGAFTRSGDGGGDGVHEDSVGGGSADAVSFDSSDSPNSRVSSENFGETRAKNVSATYYMRIA